MTKAEFQMEAEPDARCEAGQMAVIVSGQGIAG